MGLFPQAFIEDLRDQADIVQVVQDHVPLRRAGANYKGLCPFHSEKTPSFQVNRDKGFFHCFGCGVGGDVFKFVELHEKVGFQDAVRQLAQRFGMPVPQVDSGGASPGDELLRETLLKIHEVAAQYYRAQLGGPSGAQARQMLRDRGLTAETVERLGLGLTAANRDGLKSYLLKEGFTLEHLARSGLVVEREDGQVLDRFRHRLMIPICRESGAIVAFGARAMEARQQPKYLNSPETPIYSKGRTLYGLNLTKADVKRLAYAVVVEGYFDFAQLIQAWTAPVVATCGTALTLPQAKLLHRFASKVILGFDSDQAGRAASERSGELLVGAGFQVNVATFPAGQDPDGFVQQQGQAGLLRLLKTSQPFLDCVLERTADTHDLTSDTGRREFLGRMLEVTAKMPDAAVRDQFADRIALRARITEDVVRAEIRRAAVDRRPTVTNRELPPFGEIRTAEKGLIWALIRDAAPAVAALEELEPADVEGLRTEAVLRTALSLRAWPTETLPGTLLERLSPVEADLVQRIAATGHAPAPPAECSRALKRLRRERERASLQQEIDRIQEEGGTLTDRIDALWQRKMQLLHEIEALNT